MHTLASRRATAVASIALLSLGAACQSEEAGEDATPADTVATSPATDEPVSTGIEPGAASTYAVAIANPMPHAMIVSVEYDGGGETELGTVPAGGEQSFTVAASAGETVTLVAADEAGTHAPSTTIVLPAGQTETAWTIE